MKESWQMQNTVSCFLTILVGQNDLVVAGATLPPENYCEIYRKSIFACWCKEITGLVPGLIDPAGILCSWLNYSEPPVSLAVGLSDAVQCWLASLNTLDADHLASYWSGLGTSCFWLIRTQNSLFLIGPDLEHLVSDWSGLASGFWLVRTRNILFLIGPDTTLSFSWLVGCVRRICTACCSTILSRGREVQA